MIIYNIKGEKIQDVLITKSAVHEQELMKKNLIRLSWRDVEKRTFDVGTYIRPFADKGDETPYFLFQPYEAEQVNEVEYKCEPEFHHPVMYLQYVPYTQLSKDYNGNDVTKIDWTYQGGTVELLQHICEAITNALRGANLFTSEEAFSVEILASDNTGIKDSTSVTFSATDILSALNQIAQYNECEWHLSWENKTLCFGDIRLGDDEVEPITLKVDENINVASVRADKEGWWNAYLPQGGTKNMTRTMPSGEIISASTRLELDKTTYPDGYIYTDQQGNVISKEAFIASGVKKIVKTLVFDDIFPKLDLYLYDIRERRRLRYEDNDETIPSKDANGNYEYYADWYFRLAYPTKDADGNITKWNVFDGLSSRTPKAQINTYEDGNVYVRIPFVVGRNVFTTPSTTASAEYDVVAKIGNVETPAIVFGMTGDASIKHLRIPKFVNDEPTNYGKFMQLVIDGAKAMTFTQGVDNTTWSECAAEIGKLDDYTYSESLRINGTDIGGYFKANAESDKYTSPLAGREFTIDYYDTNKDIKERTHDEYGVIDTGIKISVGDYHIVREDGDIIIPTTSEGGLYPRGDVEPSTDNNIINLYNIQMTDDYVKNAQNDLANATLQEIKFYHTDNKTYTCKSNPVAFAKSNPNLYIGRKVTYVDTTGYTLSTRVMRLVTQLDFPIEQEISIGNLVIKGTQQQMRENVEAIITGSIGAGGGGTFNKSAVESIIKQYSDKRYLSKLNDDTAKGEITFEKGAKFGQNNGINEQGNATLNDVTANRYKGKNGVVNLDGDTDISGDANVSGSIDITKNAIIGGNAQISGDAEIGGLAKAKSVEIGKYAGGEFGTGAKVYVDDNNSSHLIVDFATIRKKATFNEITVKELKHVGGAIILSAASAVIERVEQTGNDYKCYFKASDSEGKTVENEFAIDDLVRCQIFNLTDGNRYYWRKVIGKGTDYIVLSATDADANSDAPMAGDNVSLFGNTTDKTRQAAIVISAYGDNTPSITYYQGVNSFDLTDKIIRQDGYDNKTQRAYTTTYGDSYVGARDESTYMRFTPEDGVEIKGKLHIESGSTGAEQLVDFGDTMVNNAQRLLQGKYNLLRNSGFTGDFVTEILSKNSVQNPNNEMFSPPLDHWVIGSGSVVVNDSAISESGKEAHLASGTISQTLNDKLIKGETYIFSLKAHGSMNLAVRCYNSATNVESSYTFTITEDWQKHIFKFVADDDYTHISIYSGNCTICELQLERGNVPSAWGRSFLDNQSNYAYYQSLRYLASAMADGSTDILGGLILTSLINLGNYKDGKLVKSTAGTSGIYNEDDDVAFWAGGSLEQAIALVGKIRNGETPTTEEWANLAKYVVTHGGDAILKGTIYADNGYFRGRLEAKEGYFNGKVDIANEKILLNDDGSGHLANGDVSWDTEGNTTIKGTIKADNFYHKVQWINYTPNYKEVTNADIVIVGDGSWGASGSTQAENTINLPDPEIYEGKVITIYSLTTSAKSVYLDSPNGTVNGSSGGLSIANYNSLSLIAESSIPNWRVLVATSKGTTSGGSGDNVVIPSEYTLPVASANTLGGVKVNTNKDVETDLLRMDGEVLNVDTYKFVNAIDSILRGYGLID